MKRQLFSLAICLILVSSSLVFSINIVSAPSGDGTVEVELNVRGTFLRAMDDFPYFGPSDGHIYDEELEVNVLTHTDFRVEEATMIDLQAQGFIEGDKIYISWLGGFYPDGAWNPNNPGSIGYGLKENEAISHGGLLGLFSTTSQLLDIDQLNRVPGAIDYGSNDYSTPDTWWQDGRAEVAEKLASKGIDWYTDSMETDIAEDFKIFPHTGMKVEIPRNARFLFLSLIDPYYRDNYEGPNGLTVTIEKDTDEDGIPDNWEINGIDIDKDGETDLDLPMLGADWEHKDIFVEVDYSLDTADLNGFESLVEQAFDNAPVSNPDGASGINLHILINDPLWQDYSIPHWQGIWGWTDFDTIKADRFGTNEERESPNSQNILDAKKLVYHYCIMAKTFWEYNGTIWKPDEYCGGIAEVSGDDLMVFIGRSERKATDIAGLFMHELGHNLGLHHGGPMNVADAEVNYKPNYLSVMNYLYDTTSLSDRPLDYSRKTSMLDEQNLDETFGIATRNGWEVIWRGPSPENKLYISKSGQVAIDWNSDGNFTVGVKVNLNNHPEWGYNSPDNEVLRSYNDWSNLLYRFRGYPKNYSPSVHEAVTVEEDYWAIVQKETESAQFIQESTEGSPEVNVRAFGLKKGDWFEYSVTWTGGEPESYYAVSFKGEVVSVTDEIIEIQWESEDVSGKTYSYTETYDVNLGGHTFDVIPGDLEIGDSIFSEDHGVIDIDGEEYYEYAGSKRMVLWAVEDFGTIHWDRETGLLVQSDGEVGELHRRMLLEKTNAWKNETTGLDLIQIVALAIVVVAVLLILIIIFRRKKKKEKTRE